MPFAGPRATTERAGSCSRFELADFEHQGVLLREPPQLFSLGLDELQGDLGPPRAAPDARTDHSRGSAPAASCRAACAGRCSARVLVR